MPRLPKSGRMFVCVSSSLSHSIGGRASKTYRDEDQEEEAWLLVKIQFLNHPSSRFVGRPEPLENLTGFANLTHLEASRQRRLIKIPQIIEQ